MEAADREKSEAQTRLAVLEGESAVSLSAVEEFLEGLMNQDFIETRKELDNQNSKPERGLVLESFDDDAAGPGTLQRPSPVSFPAHKVKEGSFNHSESAQRRSPRKITEFPHSPLAQQLSPRASRTEPRGTVSKPAAISPRPNKQRPFPRKNLQQQPSLPPPPPPRAVRSMSPRRPFVNLSKQNFQPDDISLKKLATSKQFSSIK